VVWAPKTSTSARPTCCQAPLDAGAIPKAIAAWIRQVEAERAAVLARTASRDYHKPASQPTEGDIRALIAGLGDLRDIIRGAEPPVKAAIYEQFGLKITYCPDETDSGRRDDQPGDIRIRKRTIWAMGRVRVPSAPKATVLITDFWLGFSSGESG
jgi:hypothetical protein